MQTHLWLGRDPTELKTLREVGKSYMFSQRLLSGDRGSLKNHIFYKIVGSHL